MANIFDPKQFPVAAEVGAFFENMVHGMSIDAALKNAGINLGSHGITHNGAPQHAGEQIAAAVAPNLAGKGGHGHGA